MASPVEKMQDVALTSTAIGLGNILESLPDDHPTTKAATDLRPRAQIVDLGKNKLICPIRDKWTVAGEGASAHGNGTPTEPGHAAGDLEGGGGVSLTVNSQGGFTDNPDQEGTRGLIPEEADQVSVGSVLLGDLTDASKAAKYLKHRKTYLSGLLIYGLHSSLGTLREGFPMPTPAKKALWYLLFGNVGMIFALFTMLAKAPKGSDKAKLLVKSMAASGVSLFGLNLALLYLKYEP